MQKKNISQIFYMNGWTDGDVKFCLPIKSTSKGYLNGQSVCYTSYADYGCKNSS